MIIQLEKLVKLSSIKSSCNHLINTQATLWLSFKYVRIYQFDSKYS